MLCFLSFGDLKCVDFHSTGHTSKHYVLILDTDRNYFIVTNLQSTATLHSLDSPYIYVAVHTSTDHKVSHSSQTSHRCFGIAAEHAFDHLQIFFFSAHFEKPYPICTDSHMKILSDVDASEGWLKGRYHLMSHSFGSSEVKTEGIVVWSARISCKNVLRGQPHTRYNR
jgi:hypothetical protein